MGEEHWGDVLWTGKKGQPCYYFVLDFKDWPDDAVAEVRASAEELLREFGRHRSLVRNTAKAIAQLCSVRLTNDRGAPANHWLVQATWKLGEDEEAIRGDAARIVTWANRMVHEAHDNAAAAIWGEIAEGFQRGPEPADERYLG